MITYVKCQLVVEVEELLWRRAAVGVIVLVVVTVVAVVAVVAVVLVVVRGCLHVHSCLPTLARDGAGTCVGLGRVMWHHSIILITPYY